MAIDNHHCSVLSDFEVEFAARLGGDFQKEAILLGDAELMLGGYVRTLFRGQEVFMEPNVVKQLKSASADNRKVAVWTLLVGEAYERHHSGHLLFGTGHLSRALSCVRDAWECIEWGEVCLRLAPQADRWVVGESVKAPKGFKFPARVPRLLEGKSADVLNTYGTHPYFESAMLSVLPASFDDPDDSRPYYELTRSGAATMLFVFGLAIDYVLWQVPKLEDGTPGGSALVGKIATELGIGHILPGG